MGTLVAIAEVMSNSSVRTKTNEPRHQTSSSLLRLTAAERARIGELQKILPAWNLVPLFHAAVPIACGFAAATWPYWPVYVVATVLSAFSIHAFGILMHDALHGSFFRNQHLDRLAAFLFGAVVYISGRAYWVIHLNHHRYARTDRDPDDPLLHEKRPSRHALGFLTWITVGTLYMLGKIPFTAWRLAKPRDRRRIALEYAAMGLLHGSAFAICAATGTLAGYTLYWTVPFLAATVISNARGWAEHQMTEPGHPLTNARTVITSRFFSFFLCNANYHIDHHLYPAVPWYNLPKLHAVLASRFEEQGAVVQRSYLRYLWETVRARAWGTLPQNLARRPQGEVIEPSGPAS